ncbi:hypothetical protein ACIQNU_23290 [Streptomyces sp. NPDC091292]|uniref:hypothetical protein n=1 Tax=Streptomyces sp. NPDC091292 TaxID=3365991 RepID=UPI0037F5A5FC
MKPLLLLDIDGPLNPYLALSGPVPDGYTLYRTRPESWTQSPYLPVLLNPDHGERLLGLTTRFELAWATTWKDEANEWIGPKLGLPRLPYIDWPEMHGAAPDGTYWKTQYVVAYAAGRPFAWVDDEITARDTGWVTDHHGGAALLRWVHPGTGLTRTDFEALAGWAGERLG